MSNPSRIAAIANHEGLDSQALLSDAVAAWRKAGINVAGVLAQDNSEEGPCSAGFLRDLVSGKEFSIQLDAPPAGTSCHLDIAGLEDAGANLLAQVSAADVVVLSKFGKLEAAQGGLWPVFRAAVAAGKPVLTTVSSKHNEAWKTFAPEAVWLEGDADSITRWWQTPEA